VTAREPDDLRPVDLSDEGLPEQTSDDTDTGWGEWRSSDDESRLLEDRPPHWG
jgi:hypothetical protein